MRNRHLIGMTLAAALGATGCGGGGDPVDRTESATLAADAAEHDGHNCDEYTFDAGEGWNVDILMTSEFDNYLYLATGGNDVAYNDDADSGEHGLNAQIVHTTAASGTYTVHACSLSGSDSGQYSLHIQANPGG